MVDLTSPNKVVNRTAKTLPRFGSLRFAPAARLPRRQMHSRVEISQSRSW